MEYEIVLMEDILKSIKKQAKKHEELAKELEI